MKRQWFLISVIFSVFFILSPCGNTTAEEATTKESSKTFVFPSSILVIGDEAFEGTAVETVILPDGLLSIGERAFENVLSLTDVYIPDTTEYIADSAFSITPKLTIHGIEGSYAKDWALRHKIPFVIDDIWNAFILESNSYNTQTNLIIRFIEMIVLIIIFSFFRSCYYELRSKKPQDRPELNPIDYRFP